VPFFDADGVRLAYYLEGADDGIPTALLHGFASDFELNWRGTRWIETLTRAGRLVVGLDFRGHGASDKPTRPQEYGEEVLAHDVTALLRHLEIGEADVVGYSMGGRVALRLASLAPERLGRVVAGGVGGAGAIGQAEAIAERMLGGREPGHPIADTFYEFAAARQVNELQALAACIRGLASSPALDAAAIRVPVLIVDGDRDELARGGADLAAAIPNGSYFELAGRDHLSAVPDRRFKDAALSFLDAHGR
jgi:pimeloyl-ACP methyl ester carboxylesterase